MKDLIEETLKANQGNIVEIGGGYGENTKVFGEIAKKYQRKVLVIDPFESGWASMPQGYGGYAYKDFRENIKDYHDHVFICFLPSQDSRCVEAIESIRPIAFAYVDGLQFKASVISDLELMSKFDVPLIAVDDFDRQSPISEVPIAIYEWLTYTPKYELIENKDKRRAYLKLRNGK